MGRLLQHISCATIGKMKEYKRRGIYKQKMHIIYIFLYEQMQTEIGCFSKILADCGVMWFNVNSPSAFFNAGVFFKLCIFIISSSKNYLLFVQPTGVLSVPYFTANNLF